MSQQVEIEAVVLAGGLSRRMDRQDKGLITLANKPMVRYVLDRLQPQVQHIRINANQNQAQYAQFGYEVFADKLPGFMGPLTGMYSALVDTKADYVLVVPCDCPLLPKDLAARMVQQLLAEDADVAVATDGERDHSVVLLIKPELAESIRTFLDTGRRRVDMWYGDFRVTRVSFADQPEAFVNVNTPEDKQQLTDVIAQS